MKNSGRADPLRVFVQVNTSEEAQKGGVPPGEATIALVKHVLGSCEHLQFQGLMTIGQYGVSASRFFETLSACRADVCSALGLKAEEVELSMGMSGDFEDAIAAGSTNVRVGSTIFGARPAKSAAAVGGAGAEPAGTGGEG